MLLGPTCTVPRTGNWGIGNRNTEMGLLPAFRKSDCCGIAQLISMEVESADCVWHRSLWEELHVNVQC